MSNDNNNDNNNNNNDQWGNPRNLVNYYFSAHRMRGNWHIYRAFYSENTILQLDIDWEEFVWAGIGNSDEDYADDMVEYISSNPNVQNTIRVNYIAAYNSFLTHSIVG